MPLIGISAQYRRHSERWAYVFWGIVEGYIEALKLSGAEVVLLPPQPEDQLSSILARLDGLVLTGGPDLDPLHYGEEPGLRMGEINEVRDAAELFMARYAAERGLPLLGICRGMQVATVALGGSLYQDLEQAGFLEVAHWQKSPPPSLWHTMNRVAASPLDTYFDASYRVNSYHHQGVKELGQGLVAVAKATDDLVEAAVLKEHPYYLLVQWHPEMLPSQWPMFGGLVEAGRRKPARL